MCDAPHNVTQRAALGAILHGGVGGHMQHMVKGANVGLTALSENVGSVVMSLGWNSAAGQGNVDILVLQLDANGKVLRWGP